MARLRSERRYGRLEIAVYVFWCTINVVLPFRDRQPEWWLKVVAGVIGLVFMLVMFCLNRCKRRRKRSLPPL